jgi:Ras GTPase-activating-like protein IQGAP2/3
MVELEEMRTGMRSRKPLDVDYVTAVEDRETRTEFIHRKPDYKHDHRYKRIEPLSSDLQKLLAATKDFVNAITASTRKVPYSLRYIACETLTALKV